MFLIKKKFTRFFQKSPHFRQRAQFFENVENLMYKVIEGTHVIVENEEFVKFVKAINPQLSLHLGTGRSFPAMIVSAMSRSLNATSVNIINRL